MSGAGPWTGASVPSAVRRKLRTSSAEPAGWISLPDSTWMGWRGVSRSPAIGLLLDLLQQELARVHQRRAGRRHRQTLGLREAAQGAVVHVLQQFAGRLPASAHQDLLPLPLLRRN